MFNIKKPVTGGGEGGVVPTDVSDTVLEMVVLYIVGVFTRLVSS